MKTQISLSVLLLCLVGDAMAAAPKKPSLMSYSRLWNNSPFTSKPPPKVVEDQGSAFADWALGGVSQVPGGYMVTLFNIKKVGETQVIRPGAAIISTADKMETVKPGENGSFSVVRVDHGKDSWKSTTVLLSSGGRTGSVKFEKDLIVPKAGAAPAAANPNPQIPGQPQPAHPQAGGGNSNNNGGNQRGQRPRVVPPAATR